LIEGLDEGYIEEINKGEQGIWTIFQALENWKPTMVPGTRLVWIRCMDLPLNS